MDALWALLFATAGLIAITYWRLPPEELSRRQRRGVSRAGTRTRLPQLSRIADRDLDRLARRRPARDSSRALGRRAATLLCGVTALPGVVDQHDLDAKAVNLVPAVGVAIAFVLSMRAPWERVGRLRLDLWVS